MLFFETERCRYAVWERTVTNRYRQKFLKMSYTIIVTVEFSIYAIFKSLLRLPAARMPTLPSSTVSVLFGLSLESFQCRNQQKLPRCADTVHCTLG